MAGVARYDDFADWYVRETACWGTDPISPLPEALGGQRVVELGCGYGRLARRLARVGAHMTAVDISAELLSHARERERQEPLGIG